MWQGIRGEDLDVDLLQDEIRVCSVTGVMVIYTSDRSKFAGEDAPESSNEPSEQREAEMPAA
jgi:hypothetical protein